MQLSRARKDSNTETDNRRCLEDATSFAYKGDSKVTNESTYWGQKLGMLISCCINTVIHQVIGVSYHLPKCKTC